MADNKLTPKQEMFVKEYLVDLNATQAYLRAGYSVKSEDVAGVNANRLLGNAKIKNAIQEAMNIRAKKTEITADYVLTTIYETVERCRQSYPVLDRRGNQVFVETPDGELLPAYEFDSKGVLKGCELLGKHLCLFTERVEHTGKDGGPIEHKVDLSKLTMEELDALDRITTKIECPE